MASPTPRGLHRLDTIDPYRLVNDWNMAEEATDAALTAVEAGAIEYADVVGQDVHADVMNVFGQIVGATPVTTTTTTTYRNLWPDPRTVNAAAMYPRAGTVAVVDGAYRWTHASGSFPHMYSVERPPIPDGVNTVWVVGEARSSHTSAARIQVQTLAGTSTVTAEALNETLTLGSSWTPFRYRLDLPPEVDNYRLRLFATGDLTDGEYIDYRRIGVLTGDVPWFHGGSAASESSPAIGVEIHDTFAWDGAPDASSSAMTRVSRVTTVGDWVEGTTVSSRLLELEETVSDFQDGAGGGAPSLPAPAGWGFSTLQAPRVIPTGDGFTTDLDLADLRARMVPDVAPTWASPTGDGDGLTRDTPITLASALAAGAQRIHLLTGEHRAPATTLTGPITHDVALIAAEPGVQVTGHLPTPSWTANGNGTWTATVPGVTGITHRPTPTTRRVQYELKAEANYPGRYAVIGDTVTVNPRDGIDLTATPDALTVTGSATTGLNAQGANVWAEGIDFIGHAAGTVIDGGTLVAVDCGFHGSTAGSGLSTVNAGCAVLVRCSADTNNYDGFNYHGTGEFVEIDCTSTGNGLAARRGNSNGTTSHDTVVGLRVGGHHADSHGPIVADVKSARTWSVGVSTHRDNSLAERYAHFQVSANGVAAGQPTARMWVHAAHTAGLGTSLLATYNGEVTVTALDHGAAQLMETLTGGTITRGEATA